MQGQLTQNSQQILGATCAQVATVVQKQSSTPQCALHARAQGVLFGGAPCAGLAGMLAVADAVMSRPSLTQGVPRH